MIRFVLKTFFTSIILLLVTATVLVVLMVQQMPLVMSKPVMSFNDLQRAQSIWQEYQPGKLTPGKSYQLDLKFKDAEMLMLFAAAQHPKMAYANFRYTMDANRAQVTTTLPLKELGAWGYLNIRFETSFVPGVIPRINDLRIGYLPVPNLLTRFAQEKALENYLPAAMQQQWRDSEIRVDSLSEGQLEATEMRVSFIWLPKSKWQSGGENPVFDQVKLQKLGQQLLATEGRHLALEKVMVELLSDEQMDLEGYRQWLRMLVAYSSGDLKQFNQQQNTNFPKKHLVLSGQRDLAKHFIISAMLANTAGADVAGQLGLLKELSDADHRATGYSDLDLLANHAGILFDAAVAQALTSGKHLALAEALASGELLMPNKASLKKLEETEALPRDAVQSSRLLKQLKFYQAYVPRDVFSALN